MTVDEDRPVPRRVLDAAIAWQLRLDQGADSGTVDDAHQAWLAGHPDHARAWRQLALIDAEFGSLPRQAGVHDALSLPRRQSSTRGRSGRLAVLLALAIGLSLAVSDRFQPLSGWLADLRTATGERRLVTLPDGTVLTLNARTAVDLAFDERQRAIWLRSGEVLVDTAASRASAGGRSTAGSDQAPDPRPFVVLTDDGSLRALGTRFVVSRDAAGTRLTVTEAAVLARPTACAVAPQLPCPTEQRADAGQSLQLSDGGLGGLQPAAADVDAWRQGMLVVDRAALSEVVAALVRYRPGVLQVAPEVAGLQVSGTLPLDDPERSLAALTASLPIQVRRFGGLWLRIEARARR